MRWGEKRYHSLDYELKQMFKEKVYKIALNGGMTCPNRDGHVGTGGCIFCSSQGSGDFAGSARLSIAEQIRQGKADISSNVRCTLILPIFRHLRTLMRRWKHFAPFIWKPLLIRR